MSIRDTHYFVQSVPNYKDLLFFRKSVALYDVTFAFCERYLMCARKMTMWDEKHARYEGLRKFCRETNDSEAYMGQIEKMNDEEIANMAITMCHQVDVMMTKYIGVKEREFVENGGIREAMTRARLQYRNEHLTT